MRVHRPSPGWATHAAVVTVCTALAGAAQAEDCGPLTNHYGPFDYRTQQGPRLDIVERYHFTPKVQQLVAGETSPLPGDIGYTLRAYPNHHHALVVMSSWKERELAGTAPAQAPWARSRRGAAASAQNVPLSMDCWFDRAVRFRPDDTVVRLLFAQWLTKRNRKDNARSQIEAAQAKVTDNPLSHFNIGLVALEAGLDDIALAQAHKALAMGFERTDLRDKLQAKGVWREPVTVPAAAASAAQPTEAAASAAPPAATPAASTAQP